MLNAEIAAALLLDYDHIRDYIREKMSNYVPKRMTVAELAAKINYAKGTVDNFFDGTTKRPPFDMLCLMIVAVGGSVDEAIGYKPMASAQPAAVAIPDSLVKEVAQRHLEDLKTSHRETLDAKNETIIDLRKEVNRLGNLNRKLSLYHRLFVVENCLLALVFLIDLCVPTVGWLRSLLNTNRSFTHLYRG